MLKNLARFFVIILVLLLSVEVAYAAGGKSFGGKIYNVVTPETIAKEKFGWSGKNVNCPSGGKIILIQKNKATKAEIYFWSTNVRPVTRFEPKKNQSILGLRNPNAKNQVTCTKEPKDKDDIRETKSFSAYEIKYFGTSRI